MQLLLTSAAPSNIGQGGDTIIQTQNCVSPCAWVKLIFPVSRIVIFAQVACSLRPTTRFVRVILVQAISLYHFVSFKKKLPISDLECHSCAGAMQQYPESHHLCAGAMRQCPAEDKASGSSRSSHLRTSIRGFHRFAPRKHHGRPFWRETWR